MSEIYVEASRIIDAPPAKIYDVMADMEKGHWDILPKAYFKEVKIEEGGYGAGTIYRLKMEVMGQEFNYHMKVEEPEPGRILSERDLNGQVKTRIIVDPLNNGSKSNVTIISEFPASSGVKGFFEKLFQPPITRKIYREELEILAEYVE